MTESVCLNTNKSWKDRIILLLYIVFFIVLAIAFVNQGAEFMVKADIISDPCGVCAELDPCKADCVYDCLGRNDKPDWLNNINYSE